MAQASSSAYPLQTLRQDATALEAAVLECMARAGKRSVHTLRTATRRVEAQLELLAILSDLPPHQKQQRKVTRLLKRIRHAAGAVRDLDVQRDLIRDEAAGRHAGPRLTPKVRSEAAQLLHLLKQKRERQAHKLLGILKKRGADLPAAFDKLLDALAPAEPLAVPASRFAALVRTWYAGHTPSPAGAQLGVAQLHDIRKRAKLARYLAESAPASAASARRLAAHFEALQEAGGTWHDWLLLAEVSGSALGKKAHLPQRFSAHVDRSLRAFQRSLSRHQVHSTVSAKTH